MQEFYFLALNFSWFCGSSFSCSLACFLVLGIVNGDNTHIFCNIITFFANKIVAVRSTYTENRKRKQTSDQSTFFHTFRRTTKLKPFSLRLATPLKSYSYSSIISLVNYVVNAALTVNVSHMWRKGKKRRVVKLAISTSSFQWDTEVGRRLKGKERGILCNETVMGTVEQRERTLVLSSSPDQLNPTRTLFIPVFSARWKTKPDQCYVLKSNKPKDYII